MLLLILCSLFLNFESFEGLTIINGPTSTKACVGPASIVIMSCTYTGGDPDLTPDWRIIKRNDVGNDVSNETVSGASIAANSTSGLQWISSTKQLIIRFINESYNQLSYQCMFDFNNGTIVESSVGTVMVLGGPPPQVKFTVLEVTANNITVFWPPVISNKLCGIVKYSIARRPTHVPVMKINDTLYKITELLPNTTYNISVTARNDAGSGEPVTMTVRTASVQSTFNSTEINGTLTNVSLIPVSDDATNITPSKSNEGSSSSNVGPIAGGVVGAIIVAVVVATIVVLVVICYKRNGVTDYQKEAFKSTAVVESEKAYHNDQYDEIKLKPKQPVPHQTTTSGEKYAISLKAVNNISKENSSQHQYDELDDRDDQHVPAVEYARVDNGKSKTSAQDKMLHEYDQVATKGQTAPVVEYAVVDKGKNKKPTEDKLLHGYDEVTKDEEQAPVVPYAVVEKKDSQQTAQQTPAEYDVIVEDSTTPNKKIQYAALQDLPTNLRRLTDQDTSTTYTQVSETKAWM